MTKDLVPLSLTYMGIESGLRCTVTLFHGVHLHLFPFFPLQAVLLPALRGSGQYEDPHMQGLRLQPAIPWHLNCIAMADSCSLCHVASLSVGPMAVACYNEQSPMGVTAWGDMGFTDSFNLIFSLWSLPFFRAELMVFLSLTCVSFYEPEPGMDQSMRPERKHPSASPSHLSMFREGVVDRWCMNTVEETRDTWLYLGRWDVGGWDVGGALLCIFYPMTLFCFLFQSLGVWEIPQRQPWASVATPNRVSGERWFPRLYMHIEVRVGTEEAFYHTHSLFSSHWVCWNEPSNWAP